MDDVTRKRREAEEMQKLLHFLLGGMLASEPFRKQCLAELSADTIPDKTLSDLFDAISEGSGKRVHETCNLLGADCNCKGSAIEGFLKAVKKRMFWQESRSVGNVMVAHARDLACSPEEYLNNMEAHLQRLREHYGYGDKGAAE